MNDNVETPVENVEAETPVEPVNYAGTKHKVKIDDNTEEEYSYEDLLKFAKESKKSQNRFFEASEMKKQSEELLKLAKEDPRKLLQHPLIGADLRKLANEIIAEQIEEQLLTGEQKETRAIKRELDELKNAKKQQEDKYQEEQDAAARVRHENAYSDQIIEALQIEGLPKTEYTIKRLAEYMLQAFNQGFKDVTAKDIAPLVKQDFLAEQNQLYSSIDEESLLSLLSEDVIKKVVKGHLNKAKRGQIPQNNIKKDLNSPKKEEPKKRISPEEFMEEKRRNWEAKYGKN